MSADASNAKREDGLESLLKERYPTFHSVVGELRTGGEHPRLRRWVETTRTAVEQHLGDPKNAKNAKKRAEAEGVRTAVELAASIALQIAAPPSQP